MPCTSIGNSMWRHTGLWIRTTSLDRTRDVLCLSAIFKWYARDFGGRAGVAEFLSAHLPDDERRAWLSRNGRTATFVYKPYDWTLNL